MAKFVAGSLNLTPVFTFLFVHTRFVFYGTPWQYCVAFTASICLYILGNYGHARSQDGRQPAAAKPPLYTRIMPGTPTAGAALYT